MGLCKPEEQERAPLLRLPRQLLALVLTWLDGKSLGRALTTCRTLAAPAVSAVACRGWYGAQFEALPDASVVPPGSLDAAGQWSWQRALGRRVRTERTWCAGVAHRCLRAQLPGRPAIVAMAVGGAVVALLTLDGRLLVLRTSDLRVVGDYCAYASVPHGAVAIDAPAGSEVPTIVTASGGGLVRVWAANRPIALCNLHVERPHAQALAVRPGLIATAAVDRVVLWATRKGWELDYAVLHVLRRPSSAAMPPWSCLAVHCPLVSFGLHTACTAEDVLFVSWPRAGQEEPSRWLGVVREGAEPADATARARDGAEAQRIGQLHALQRSHAPGDVVRRGLQHALVRGAYSCALVQLGGPRSSSSSLSSQAILRHISAFPPTPATLVAADVRHAVSVHAGGSVHLLDFLPS